MMLIAHLTDAPAVLGEWQRLVRRPGRQLQLS